jgi:hypothetical protein
MKYIVSSNDFPNHPNPKETEIAFVLVKYDTLISYNFYGQRLGRLKKIDEEYMRVYYSRKEIILIDSSNEIYRFRYDFRKLPKKLGYFETHYLNSDKYKRSIHFYDKLFFRQNEEQIFNHFDYLISNWEHLIQLDLTSKYNQENFLDIFAIIEINRFELTSNRLILRFYNRILKEMKYEIETGQKNLTFPTVGDILYNELNQVTMFKMINVIEDQFRKNKLTS